MYKFSLFFFLTIVSINLSAQADRWQQRAEYKMEIDVDVSTNQFTGKQTITYYNNSPDALDRVFYHLYFNAFQPGSMMDERSRTLPDSDPRVGSRISKLKANEEGWHKVISLKQDGKETKFQIEGTILEVDLASPILAGKSTVLEMEFQSQIPVQIRRTGRDNKEGIRYSMSQWYPKLCEYDYQGWHANPYVGREFHGIWGNFDVKITIDNQYILGGSGYIQNPNDVGYGYQDKGVAVKHEKGKKLTWHFNAPNVHDFFWAADPDYKHTKMLTSQGVMMHFLYQENEKTRDNWAKLPEIMAKAQGFMDKHYGKYPYKQYSFIQGGDGGMEYPMGTLITGERSLPSLVGVSVHEWFHSWYQMVLGFNEALYAWMDEGFTTFGSGETMKYLRSEGLLPAKEEAIHPHMGSYRGYFNVSSAGYEEALTTHADHFTTNTAYGVGSYSKGCVFLNQLQYIVGKEAFAKGMLDFYNTWKFKHPNANDFIRIMEKTSGLELDWYREYWVQTTHTIDYAVKGVEKGEKSKMTNIQLEKIGVMPMPIDVVVTLDKGEKLYYTIPLRIMRGEKLQDGDQAYEKAAADWPWTHSNYTLSIPVKSKKVVSVEIDPTKRMADTDESNNVFKID